MHVVESYLFIVGSFNCFVELSTSSVRWTSRLPNTFLFIALRSEICRLYLAATTRCFSAVLSTRLSNWRVYTAVKSFKRTAIISSVNCLPHVSWINSNTIIINNRFKCKLVQIVHSSDTNVHMECGRVRGMLTIETISMPAFRTERFPCSIRETSPNRFNSWTLKDQGHRLYRSNIYHRLRGIKFG